MSNSKKAVVGIGTLIVFIAMVLVAAIASSVLVRTSAILQDRAFAVGNEARQRLVTGIDIISVIGNADVEAERITSIELLVRLSAGSYSVQLKSSGLTYTSRDLAVGATLQHQDVDTDADGRPFDTLIKQDINSTYSKVRDLDGDQTLDEVRIVGFNATSDALQFRLSKSGRIAYTPLGVQATTGEHIVISDKMIKEYNYTATNGAWGFVNMDVTLTSDNVIKPTDGETHFSLNPMVYRCSPDKIDLLIPETRYCSYPQLGDSDQTIESGEILRLLYRLKESRYLMPDQSFDLQFIPKRGSIVLITVRTPDVIASSKIPLWP